MDTSEFGQPGFNVKVYINSLCSKKPVEEPLEKYLSQTEMRLHLASEDVEASLEAEGSRAVRRMPMAATEIAHIQSDVGALAKEVAKALQQLSISASRASQAVEVIRETEVARSRMQDATSTLKDATELADLWANIDSLFAGGDVHRIAAALGTMGRSAPLVAAMPGLQDMPSRLPGLEDRLQSLVEPQLAAALAKHDGSQVQQLARLLAGIQRAAMVGQMYVSARLPSLMGGWGAQEGPLASWLPRWQAEVLSTAERESTWASAVLPEQHPQLVVQLLRAALGEAAGLMRRRLLSLAAGDQPVAQLMSICESCSSFGEALPRVLPDLSTSEAYELVVQHYQPLYEAMDRYGDLEVAQLREAAPAVDAASAGDVEGLVEALRGRMQGCAAACEAALGRCRQTTGSSELPALTLIADRSLADTSARMQAAVEGMRSRVLPDPPAATGRPASQPPAQDPMACLSLVKLAQEWTSLLQELSAAWQTAVADLSQVLQQPKGALDVVSVRLHDHEGQLLKQLQTFVSTASAPGFVAFARATRAGEALRSVCDSLVYEALMLKVHSEVRGLARQGVWAQGSQGGALGLPVFSAYPQASVTSVGEYLMLLPHHLEPLGAPGQAQHLDAAWLDRVAGGAAGAVVDQLSSIARLTPAGSQQLAADLEYLCNVLSALGVDIPQALAIWQVAVSWQPAEFSRQAAEAAADGTDRSVLERIAHIRNLAIG